MAPLDAASINAFLAQTFAGANPPEVLDASPQRVRCRIRFEPSQIRPGGTLSGPTMMMLADTAAYALLFANVGLEPLAVTTNLSINFLRKPAPADLVAEARLLKLGKGLMVCEVDIRTEGAEAPCAHAVVTYARPPKG